MSRMSKRIVGCRPSLTYTPPMDRYNLRTTSLNTTQLTTELDKRGAQTFGSQQRKQQRLQRFIDAETLRTEREQHLQRFLDREERRIQTRHEKDHQALRATILAGSKRSAPEPTLRRSSRISDLVSQYLGY